MAKVLASLFTIEVNTGTTVAPVWSKIGQLETLEFSGSVTEIDDSTMDNDGWDSSAVVGRGRSLKLDGFYDDEDEGQNKLRDLNEEIGEASKGQFRFYRTDSGEGKEFTASVNISTNGGGQKKQFSKLSAELKVSGKPTDVTVAAA